MRKSSVLHNNEQFWKFMRDARLWTNLNYTPPTHKHYHSENFPMIVHADYSMDYDNRQRVHVYETYLKDFTEETNIGNLFKEVLDDLGVLGDGLEDGTLENPHNFLYEYITSKLKNIARELKIYYPED